MKACTSPTGHQWENALYFQPKSGSMPVVCTICKEAGFRINNQVVEPNVGQPGEELF